MSAKNDMLPVDVAPESADGGTITYANEVIAIISGIAASEIEGIAGMVTSGGFGDIIGKNRNITRGVKVEVGTQEVSVDLYAMVEYGQPIQTVASQVQENVRKSIETMTGLKVVRVDVHIQGVSFEKEKREVQSNLESANVPNLMGSSTKKKPSKAAHEEKAADRKGKRGADKQAQPEKKEQEPEAKPEEDRKAESGENGASEPEVKAPAGEKAEKGPQAAEAAGSIEKPEEAPAPDAEKAADKEEKAPAAKPAKRPRKA